ncbi:preprotein translocase subunit YajC [Catenulispora rubra]|uniref:preprotein translocase subunit YajC n=1 Tax=Catenulispora rubra TaxID=280293 RepID=UPI0018924637|nr:preprotein translocase subunit YajC [Catenulispora rubra]
MGSPVFLIWIVLIGAMFYFMMIRPQKRARAQQSDMLQHLQPGAYVRTTAQIMGTIVEVGDDWAIVETTPGTRIKFGKPAIVGIIMEDEDVPEGEDAEDAPTPGGIGDAPHGLQDAIPAQDAVPAQDAKPADADDADDAVKSETDKSDTAKSDAEPADSEGSAEEVKDAEPAKS